MRATMSRGGQELSRECKAGSKHMSRGVKRVKREWQIDGNRESKYVKRVQEGVRRISRELTEGAQCQLEEVVKTHDVGSV